MQFIDGWRFQPGVTPHYARVTYRVTRGERSLTFLAPTKRIRNRGDTLDGPVLTVTLSSPMEDVLRVRIEHFTGGQDRGPHFELHEAEPEVRLNVEETVAELTSGKLTASVPTDGDWQIRFSAEGKILTGSGVKGAAYMQVEGEGAYTLDQLNLAVGECVYGLGERFTPFVKNGQRVDIWHEDSGTNTRDAYKNVPFYMTNRGYGVLVNTPGKVSFEVASERTERVQFSVPGESVEYLVIYGPTPVEVLQRYTALTGRPALPPPWSFGLWLTTSFTTDYDEQTVTEFIQGMEDRDIPLSVFHYDCFWMRGMNWVDFEWDPEVFPDPEGMLARLRERGLRVCTWINPYIAQASPLFEEAKEKGYLIKCANGDVWQTDIWQAGMAVIDFTNPDAKAWYQGFLERLLDQGVDALKTDFGERLPEDGVYHDGSDPHRMHNYYTHLYNQAVFEVLEKKRGKGKAVLFARSATAGGQQYPVHWGGDCWSNYEAMAESLRGGLSLSCSGFGFWSHDIGGFEGKPPMELYCRWAAFGLLSSHSRLHGSSSYRVPWQWDSEVPVNVLRKFTRLKHRLMPYLWTKAVEAHETGVPMMRPMWMEFPDDPGCAYLDRQYMLGESLLVAPVFSDEGDVEYYVPAGKWTKLLTGEEIEGPRWVRERHDLDSIPLLVRPDTLLPIGTRDDGPDYDYLNELEVVKFGDPKEARIVRGGKGKTNKISTSGAISFGSSSLVPDN
ncbi:MAG: alpha-xylosidase [Fimbriimonadaceae bacterium]